MSVLPNRKTFTKAFTMVELVFVIVILGIVASIGATIMAQLFENYIIQRAMHKVSLKTELAANQIAARLSYALPSSVIVYDDTTNATYQALSAVSPTYSNVTPQVLEWIGIDNDSFSTGVRRAGWSGYCDTNNTVTTGTNIYTPGSNLTLANTVIANLGGTGLSDAALFFSTGGNFSTTLAQRATCYGYLDQGGSCTHQVLGNADTLNITLDTALDNNDYISQHYKMAWSAYALVPTAIGGGAVTDNNLFELHLKYNYQPWDGSQFTDNGISDSLLITNVTSFKFAQQGNSIRFKLCATERIGDANTTNISVCKEKVVIR